MKLDETGILLALNEPSGLDLGFVCCPHAGGSALAFRDWAPLLMGRASLWAAEYSGRGMRSGLPEMNCLKVAAAEVAAATAALPVKNVVLIGHSMGALIALEAAERLTASRAAPLALVVCGHEAPPEEARTGGIWADDDLLDYLKTLRGTASSIVADDELRLMMLQRVRADFEACDRYVYEGGRNLRCPLVVLSGAHDHSLDRRGLSRWTDFTGGSTRILELEGGHFFLNERPEKVLQSIMHEIGLAAVEGLKSS